MSKIKKGILFTALTALLIVAITLTVFLAPQQANASGSISLDLKQYTVENLTSEFDSIGYDGENTNRIIAHKTDNKEVLNGFVDVSLIDTEKVRTAYDTEYVPEEDMIYLAVSTFDENDVLLNVEVATAYPIRYEDGSVDAMFDIDGTSIQLSEILTGNVEDCFALTLFFGVFSAAKIVAAIVTTAKVVAVVTGVVAVGHITYQVASMTKEKYEARKREAEKEKRRNKKNPKYYYKASIKNDMVLITAKPDSLIEASKNMQKYHTSYWSAFGFTAKNLIVRAFGSWRGPEIDTRGGKPIPGHYEHYHPRNNPYSIHSWFGAPYAGKY